MWRWSVPQAATENRELRQALAQLTVALTELRRIAVVEGLGRVQLGMAQPRGVGADTAPAPRARTFQHAADVVGMAQLIMNYAAARSAAAATRSMASPSGSPEGGRPSVSTVNDIASGSLRPAPHARCRRPRPGR